MTATERIAAYIARRKKSTGTDHEVIHGYDTGPDCGVDLLLSDIEELMAAATARSAPTDISVRLRECAANSIHNASNEARDTMLTAADECERFYGGMMAWKKTAETKDRKLSQEIEKRISERCAARAFKEACPLMHDGACSNRHQCWEPCGELGKSAKHARIAPQAAQPAGDERAAFEAWARSNGCDSSDMARSVAIAGEYAWGTTQAKWCAWQARAAIAAQQPTPTESATQRGFAKVDFKDRNGAACTIQKSSIATEDAVWIGVNDAAPQVLARDAELLGINTRETVGWIPYPIPEQVLLRTRMHLTRDGLRELMPVLQRFVDTGDVSMATDESTKGGAA